ncbi:glycoside hydrolase family 16 protein [Metabacillus sp. HB246100]
MRRRMIIYCMLSLFLLACQQKDTKEKGEELSNFEAFSKDIVVQSFSLPEGNYVFDNDLDVKIELEIIKDELSKLYLQYELQDPHGDWFLAQPEEYLLTDEKIQEVKSTFKLPHLSISGDYVQKITVWDKEPTQPNANKLFVLHSDKELSLFHHIESFLTFDHEIWEIRKHAILGKGPLLAENVSIQAGQVKIRVEPEAYQGGEVRTKKLLEHGAFETTIKVAHQPGSITGFFLYAPPDYYHEIDIEIYNDSSGTILFTAYKDGEEAEQIRQKLPFDPTENFHVYRFEMYRDGAAFYVEGELFQTFEEDYSTAPMQLMINSWYPTWVKSTDLHSDEPSETVVESISY